MDRIDFRGDDDLRKLLDDCLRQISAMLLSLRGVRIPEGDDGYLWRWAFFYLVLAADLGGSARILADGFNNRALLILRRILFEHMVRLKYYRRHPEVARAHLDDFTPRVELFHERLGNPDFKPVLDPTFDRAAHKPHRKRFEEILRDVIPDRWEDCYASFYTYPSALLHGDALASLDILELRADGSFHVHGNSRRTNTDETLFNYVAFLVNLMLEAARHLDVGGDETQQLRSRLDTVREALGIVQDL